MVEHLGFAEFYEAEHGRVVTSLLLATGHVDTARDAADEAFLRALMAWPRVQQMDHRRGGRSGSR
jgi:predicted RNA polymerase sigma factor